MKKIRHTHRFNCDPRAAEQVMFQWILELINNGLEVQNSRDREHNGKYTFQEA